MTEKFVTEDQKKRFKDLMYELIGQHDRREIHDLTDIVLDEMGVDYTERDFE